MGSHDEARDGPSGTAAKPARSWLGDLTAYRGTSDDVRCSGWRAAASRSDGRSRPLCGRRSTSSWFASSACRSGKSSRWARWPAAAASCVNDNLIRSLGIGDDELGDRRSSARPTELHRREQAYRGGRPPRIWPGEPSILVDDGIATGASMLAAVRAVRARSPARRSRGGASPSVRHRRAGNCATRPTTWCVRRCRRVRSGRAGVRGLPPGHRRRSARTAGHADRGAAGSSKTVEPPENQLLAVSPPAGSPWMSSWGTQWSGRRMRRQGLRRRSPHRPAPRPDSPRS